MTRGLKQTRTMMDEILMTFDVDWAPDFIIRHVAELLRASNIRSTWFATHDSEAIRELDSDPRFEVGIHPASYTTDGMKESMKELKRLFPNAISMRTHALLHSSILRRVERLENDILIDSSIYLREMPNIVPFYTYYDSKPLLNIPFYWTEDGEMYSPGSSFIAAKKAAPPGLKVFVYHPVHIWLNSSSMDRYEMLKKKFGPPGKWLEEDLAIEKGGKNGIRGASDHLMEMLQICADRKSLTLKDLAGKV